MRRSHKQRWTLRCTTQVQSLLTGLTPDDDCRNEINSKYARTHTHTSAVLSKTNSQYNEITAQNAKMKLIAFRCN
jgi:hypothetical protein